MTSEPVQREALFDHLRLALTPGVGPVRLRRLLDHFGSADGALRAPAEALASVPGLGPATARRIVADRDRQAEAAERELDHMDRVGAHAVLRGGPGYPTLLNDLPDAPSVLYVRGSLEAVCVGGPPAWPVAIVGSRRCTDYGRRQANAFAAGLATTGCAIVSGGARGIDAAAHEAALGADGVTICVLGCGLAACYPPEHGELFEAIVASGRGAVVSELPMAAPPVAENFPARNRIISGMSLATLVIEAGARSGALITARLAVEEHGRDVFALPGRIGDPASVGALDLVKRGGAALATEPADVLDGIASVARLCGFGPAASTTTRVSGSRPPANGRTHSPAVEGVDAPARAPLHPLVAMLGDGCTFEALVERSGKPAAALQAEITMLEISGMVRRDGLYLRNAR